VSEGILGIGTSALQAYQRALQVTGHNIANVGTEGYSRERVELSARQPEYFGDGAIGTGVEVTGITRTVDEFQQLRLSMATSAANHDSTMLEFSKPLADLLGDPQAGLSPALSQFFGAVSDVANDPTSIAARQQLISQGQSLLDRFGQLESRIDDQRVLVNGKIQTSVAEINRLATGVASLNRRIVEAKGSTGGAAPNDLLDQRDQLLQQLSAQVSINTVAQDDGSLNVYMGQGQALVVGNDANPLLAKTSVTDPSEVDVALGNGASTVVISDFVSGGRLGALLEVRHGLLDDTSNALGRIALAVTTSFNDVHALNMDLRGQQGGAFFDVPALPVKASSTNAASGSPLVTIADVGALEASDYNLRFDGSNWALTRLSDGQQLGSVPAGGNATFDGLTVDVAGVSGASAGDTFILQPMRVASGLDVRVTDPRAVAAALPVRADVDTGNTAHLSVLDLRVTDPTNPALRTASQITFSGGAYLVDGQTIALDPSGDTVIDHNGWRLVVRGTPADGDVIRVTDNAGGVGDNRGARALAALADQGVISGGTTSFAAGYGQLTADVGIATQRAQSNSDIQNQLLGDAQASRDSVSGVNLDEEAANLLRFQQAYQAAAQVIATANTLFDTLLGVLRR
jgi:flagellar hook-associated protein 1 FlgK